jgi:hypothetical protein
MLMLGQIPMHNNQQFLTSDCPGLELYFAEMSTEARVLSQSMFKVQPLPDFS